MHAALQHVQDVHIAPSLDIELPVTKKGPPYNADFVVFKSVNKKPLSKENNDTTGFVVYSKDVPIMVVEAKAGIPIRYVNVPSQNYMELFIYCIYIMRTTEAKIVLACLTDGKTWHVFKVSLTNGCELSLHTYLSFANENDQVIMNTIPYLLTLI